tara:strand:+ start:987 stop:1574 length:588 start_codon:yes stop_codon:yes gene_type:complete
MKPPQGQGEFFDFNSFFGESTHLSENISLSPEQIQKWQLKVHSHQEKFFKGDNSIHQQTNLFSEMTNNLIDKFKPLKLTPLPLSFWRLQKSYHEGPAIYVVMDLFDNGKKNIILYLGETIAADQRWKGEHDCKSYIANYLACLNKADIASQLSIRFWTDVPTQTRARRKLEQELIQRWLPPFNKETRVRWQTPFT